MTDSDRWEELAPEAFADIHHPILKAMRGTLILVRLNQIGADDALLSYEILAGQLIRANRSEGFVLSLVGKKSGELLFLPLVPAAFTLQAPGSYLLSCGTVIDDPAFLGAFDIYRPS
ncbi:hypothetical protein AEAC466_03295 [Asticcacaulis sp. AC466]|uniref:hypothetical protein n=1 Tax=Asticcacaulis sp. AC466 TaxID=1282362 RepID=UPI0003C3FE5C|nr:hypothetical protein [Asticcacaulis sp. AC466]ESQ86235.1 hypothetical protein AEAC466_03295 [Asticcacaulis sp. AC466]